MTREHIKEIIDEQGYHLIDVLTDQLDCERIHKVMEYLDWTWVEKDCGRELREYIPSPLEIYKHARALVKDALDYMRGCEVEKVKQGAGGLVVEVEIEDGVLHGELSFCLSNTCL